MFEKSRVVMGMLVSICLAAAVVHSGSASARDQILNRPGFSGDPFV